MRIFIFLLSIGSFLVFPSDAHPSRGECEFVCSTNMTAYTAVIRGKELATTGQTLGDLSCFQKSLKAFECSLKKLGENADVGEKIVLLGFISLVYKEMTQLNDNEKDKKIEYEKEEIKYKNDACRLFFENNFSEQGSVHRIAIQHLKCNLTNNPPPRPRVAASQKNTGEQKTEQKIQDTKVADVVKMGLVAGVVVGAVFTVVGGVCFYSVNKQVEHIRDRLGKKDAPSEDIYKNFVSAQHQQTAAIVLLSIGGVALVASVLWTLYHPRPKSQTSDSTKPPATPSGSKILLEVP